MVSGCLIESIASSTYDVCFGGEMAPRISGGHGVIIASCRTVTRVSCEAVSKLHTIASDSGIYKLREAVPMLTRL